MFTKKMKLAKLVNMSSDQKSLVKPTIIKLTSLASSKTERDVWAGNNLSN